MKIRHIWAVLLVAAALSLMAEKKPFSPPPATHAKTYPAHEAHDDEKVSIAIDPFDSPDKAAIFHTKFRDYGYLPVRIIISNDSDQTLIMDNVSIEYIAANRQRLEPATQDDLYRRLAHVEGPNRKSVPIPIPLPKRPKPAVKNETLTEIEDAQFVPFPVEAHNQRSGFLFFDISGIDAPEVGAHVYISGIKAGGKELFYFDIPLEKYLSRRPAK